ncbi:class II fructose-bisphosphate aldolase [Streptomyces sp. NPDC059466]|uniref:class II fructose-bisphosphate aldolase n=1 Tax=Streptomyces sp. NPDC059466 TaxID=3346843 RepID=UPI0036A42AC4
MPLAATGDLIAAAAGARTAVAAFNVITLEHVEAVIAGAESAGAPVVLQVSENAVKFRYGRLLPLARAAAAAAERAAAAQETGARPVFALPPADADRSPEYIQAQQAQQAQLAQQRLLEQGGAAVGAGHLHGVEGRHDVMSAGPADEHTPPQPHPVPTSSGRRRAQQAPVPAQPGALPPGPLPSPQVQPPQVRPAPAQPGPVQHGALPPGAVPAGPTGGPAQGAPVQSPPVPGLPGQAAPAQGRPAAAPLAWPAPNAEDTSGAGTPAPVRPGAPAAPVPPAAAAPQPPRPRPESPAPGTPLPPELPAQAQPQPSQRPQPQARVAQPLPAEAAAPVDPNSTQGRAISVRTLGQGVPFGRQGASNGSQASAQTQSATPPPHQTNGSGRRRKLGTPPTPVSERPESAARAHPTAGQAPGTRLPGATDGAGRSYAIGAPDKNADEGPEPLDGPGGAVEVADQPHPRPVDDELPPEPLDNPRRLLVWPAPDVTTQQALSDRGYRPVIVHSREEVDAQIAAFPAALFVDPLTGPITRTALQSLRQAAVAAEVPVLVTAGLGQATREAAYGADPAVLLKALAPRDSEQHPPRVLLIEEHAEIALALTSTLERRGMQVARASTDEDAVTLASQLRPNLVVMDLMQVRRRRAGIVDWLRANGQLNRTPLVVYTAAVDQAELPRLAAGETVLFLAERSTSAEVQDRIVDLLARIGTN